MKKDLFWVFYYNDDIYESVAAAMSFHKSKEGALKAMRKHEAECKAEFNDYINALDEEAREYTGKYNNRKEWFIKSEVLED